MIWYQKHQPRTIEEIPQEMGILALKTALQQKKKAIIINGPTGSGKTTAVHTLAKQYDYEILEVNASDIRNKEQIESILGLSSQQMSLFMKEKIILVDEIDGLSGQADRGALPALKEIIEQTKFPIIMTCNDLEDEKFKDFKKKAFVINFEKIQDFQIEKILQNICGKENIKLPEQSLSVIIKNANGDLRAAITDLWSNAKEECYVESRDAEESINQAMQSIFKEKEFKIVLAAPERANMELNELSAWIEENVFAEYKDIYEQEEALRYIALADVFKTRITRWQHWRFLVYQNAFLSAGVASARKREKLNMVKYKRPEQGLKIWMANMKLAKRKQRAEILAKHTHSTKREILKNYGVYEILLNLPRVIEKLHLTEEQQEAFAK